MEHLLDGLTEMQRDAVTDPHSPLCIVAGAGSGKTRVLTRRLAYQAEEGAVDPLRSLVVTFTRKAALELGSRLRRLGLRDGVEAGTFHALAYAQLRARWADRGVRPPDLLDRPASLLRRVLPEGLSPQQRSSLQSELAWAAAGRITASTYADAASAAGRSPQVPAADVSAVIERYRTEKRRRRVVDFDDLLELAIRDLADPEYAATRHWRFRHLFVDEFQDVNRLQFDLLEAWLGPHATLCVVGDPNQAIYGWNGADARFLTSFTERFPGGRMLRLRENFRSTPQILALATGVLGAGATLVPTRPRGPEPVVTRAADPETEARAIARRARDRHGPGARWRDQAVLVRTNAQTALLAQAFRAAGIPVAVRGGASLLETPVAKQLLGELYRSGQPVAGLLTDLRTDAGAAEDPDDAAALMALADLAAEHLHLSPDAIAAEFVPWVRATLQAEGVGAVSDAVEIATFHAAKGLEWPIVHLAGLEEGLVPHALAANAEALGEERRLFHVALTRAADELRLSWVETRQFGDRVVSRRPSPFLRDALGALDLVADQQIEASDGRERARGMRRALHDPDGSGPPADDQGRDALDAWRTQQARAAGTSTQAVLTDADVDALVAATPTTTAEVAGVIGPVRAPRWGEAILAALRSGHTEPAH